MSNSLTEIFSRKIRVQTIGEAAPERRISATAAECKALGVEFGLPAIASLTGAFAFTAGGSGPIDARLALQARVTQICVVSLEAFEVLVTETAELRFVPAAGLREDALLAELSAETLDGPDEIPYAGDEIDLGAALAEQLALALDPYPRKPGAGLPATAGDGAANPFAGLAALRRRPANDPE